MTKFLILTRPALEAYDQLSLPVWLFSTRTLRIIYANSAALRWTGFDAPTLQQMTIVDLRPEVERARVIDQIHRFDGIRADVGTWTIISKTGEHRSASITWSKVHFEGDEAVVASIHDVTQTEQAEAAVETLRLENEGLRRTTKLSMAHLMRLLDGLPGKMIVLTPRDYQIVAVTDEYAQAVMLDRESLLGRYLFEVFPDNPTEPTADGASNLRASLHRAETLRIVDVMNVQRYPVRRDDGGFQERFWLPRNKPILNSDGDVIYLIHRVEDVTDVVMDHSNGNHDAPLLSDAKSWQFSEMRTAFLALQERETRLKTAEKLLDLGSWEYEFERGVLTWSSRVFAIYGVPILSGPPNFDAYVALVHPDDREEMVANYTRFFHADGSELTFEHRIIHVDGSVSYVRGVGAKHHVEGRKVLIGFVQDITDIKMNEEKLRREARRRRLADRLARLGSWRVDLERESISWSEETAQIHDEPVGFSPTFDEAISYYIPEHRELIKANFRSCIAEGISFDETLQIETAKGRRVWVRALGEPVRNEQGGVIAVEGALQDITDLIQMRQEAADLSARLRQILESMSDGFFLLDDEWRFVFLNTKAELLLRRHRNELVGKVVWAEFPEAIGSFKKHYEISVAEKTLVRFHEYYAPLQTWFEITAEPTVDGLAVYFRDVTQERARNDQLRLLEAATARQQDILLITEAEPIEGPGGPKIVYVNDAFERRTGFSRSEAIGQTPRILQGPKTQREELDRIRDALRAWQPVRAELINYTKSGDEFWLELDIVPLANEKGWFTHWIAVERDISERKTAELAIQTSEERFRLVAKASGSAIWDWDVTTGKQWWSDGLREIFGHEVDPTGKVPTVWRQHVHVDDIKRAEAAIEGLLAGRDPNLRLRYRFRRGDGSWATVEDRAFPMYDSSGNLTRVLGSMTDISQQTLLEDRLRQAQKMEAVGQLTGGVAHDFNNLLTVIIGNAEILENELSEHPELHRLAKMTLQAADRGADLTSRLLAFSRRQPLEPKVLNVAELVQGMDGLFRRTLPEDIDIEIIRLGGLWKIEADAAQLESALLNLVVNARDAMPNGGRLTIETANAMLDDDYVASEPDVRPGQYVVIVVTDTGRGMPQDVLARVFEPFFTTKAAGKGSGLGLSMVFGYVKQSGGHIRIYSEPDEGTSVKMYFPRCRVEREDVVVVTPSRTIVGGKEIILLVEDDDEVRSYVSAQLHGLGYEILEASSGAEAWRILETGAEIDLLFTDVVMPGGMGGRELADAARKIRPDLRVLFTSGYTENSIVHHGRLDPGVKLLTKPYRREQLATKIREVLDDEVR